MEDSFYKLNLSLHLFMENRKVENVGSCFGCLDFFVFFFTTMKAFYNGKYNKKGIKLSFRMGTKAQNLET